MPMYADVCQLTRQVGLEVMSIAWGVLPSGKAQAIEDLQRSGHVVKIYKYIDIDVDIYMDSDIDIDIHIYTEISIYMYISSCYYIDMDIDIDININIEYRI
jgi:hypothetical protein